MRSGVLVVGGVWLNAFTVVRAADSPISVLFGAMMVVGAAIVTATVVANIIGYVEGHLRA